MKIECPFCKSIYNVEEQYRGIELECPSCKNTFYAVEYQPELQPISLHKKKNLIEQKKQSDLIESSLISCPDCNKKVSKQADKCPNCGRPFLEKNEKKVKVYRRTYILLGLFFGMMGLHNLYAGYVKEGFMQMGLGLISGTCIVVDYIPISVYIYIFLIIWSFANIICKNECPDGQQML